MYYFRHWLLCQRSYSRWPPYYQEPVVNKDELKEQLSVPGEKERLAAIPFRAAKSDQTCSVFFDPEINIFTNYVMRKGRKDLAKSLVEKTFENVKRIQLKKYYQEADEVARSKIILDPKAIFHSAVNNCKPVLQLIPIKKGGVTYQVPVSVTEKQARFLAMNWLIRACKETPKGVQFPDTLAKELLDASNNSGKIVNKKIDLHRQCEANRAYAHFRWS